MTAPFPNSEAGVASRRRRRDRAGVGRSGRSALLQPPGAGGITAPGRGLPGPHRFRVAHHRTGRLRRIL